MNVLITGATSFIGRFLAEALMAEGVSVYGVVRPSSEKNRLLPAGLHVLSCDMDECYRLAEMDLPEMTACVHLAWGGTTGSGRMDPDCQQRNIRQSMEMIRTAAKIGCERFLFAGSQAEYGATLERIREGRQEDGPMTEERECEPVSEYGKAKLAMLERGGRLCEELGMTYVHMRIFSVYGPGDQENSLVSTCLREFPTGEDVHLGPCEQMWNYLYVTDCAAAIAGLCHCVWTMPEDAELTEHAVNIGSAESRPLRDYVREIQSVLRGSRCLFETRETPPGGTPYLWPDVRKLQRLTGFREAVSFAEGIRRAKEKRKHT